MSRKARMPIPIPQGVEVKLDGETFSAKGPKGSATRSIMRGILLEIADGQIMVTMDSETGITGNFLGLYWALISNMVAGVKNGFEKRLEMIGVGYRAAVQARLLDLQIGLSHPTKMPIPAGIDVAVEKNTIITIKGLDKQLVGQFAADIRSKKPPEPYKGKGIRYSDEFVRRKAGKSGKAGKK